MCLFLKHSEFFFVIKRQRTYIGNKKEWNMSPEEEREFDKNAKIVREEAEKFYNKCKLLFEELLPNKKKFWDEFKECEEKFKKVFEKLTKEERQFTFELPKSVLDFYEQVFIEAEQIEKIKLLNKAGKVEIKEVVILVTGDTNLEVFENNQEFTDDQEKIDGGDKEVGSEEIGINNGANHSVEKREIVFEMLVK